MRIATGPPIGPVNAVNGLNDAFWWHAHSLYGLVKEIWKLPPSAPKFKICIICMICVGLDVWLHRSYTVL